MATDEREARCREIVERSRKRNPNCGCEKRGERLFRCGYHEGMEDGFREACEWQREQREKVMHESSTKVPERKP